MQPGCANLPTAQPLPQGPCPQGHPRSRAQELKAQVFVLGGCRDFQAKHACIFPEVRYIYVEDLGNFYLSKHHILIQARLLLHQFSLWTPSSTNADSWILYDTESSWGWPSQRQVLLLKFWSKIAQSLLLKLRFDRRNFIFITEKALFWTIWDKYLKKYIRRSSLYQDILTEGHAEKRTRTQ